LFLLFSCSGESNRKSLLTIPVERQDYVDKIIVFGNLESVRTVAIQAPAVMSNVTINYLIPEGTIVKAGDTVCMLEAQQLEEEYHKAVDEYEITRAEFNKSKADLQLQYLLLESQAHTIDISTTITKLDSLQLQFTSPLERRKIELELEKAEIERRKVTDKLTFLKSINDSELQRMELRIKQERNKIDRARDQLNKLVLTSDVDGLVMYATSWQTGNKVAEGDDVWWNMPLLEIPQMGEMQAKLFVNQSDFKQIETGQQIQLRIDAIPDLVLSGSIKRKSPVGKPIKRGSAVKVFEIIAALDSSSIDVQPGLSVTCDVYIQRIADTVVIPVVSIFEEDSVKVVYVQKGKKYRMQPVDIAFGNNKFAVIRSGLTGVENITTSKPPESLILN
jgi:multidrug efflux pump subunit AcrA (membrane-fusion protein)